MSSANLAFESLEDTAASIRDVSVRLHRTAGYNLGVDPTEKAAPLLALADNSRPDRRALYLHRSQTTTQAKYWSNPEGWRSIIKFLKEAGYRVIRIDSRVAENQPYPFSQSLKAGFSRC